MPRDDYPVPVLRSKLLRPIPAPDIVISETLLGRLEAGRELPLTLVSAPAGYRKSSLVSSWLEASEVLAGLLSNDLHDLEARVVVALDDYQRIEGTAVNAFLDSLPEHPPRGLHLEGPGRRKTPPAQEVFPVGPMEWREGGGTAIAGGEPGRVRLPRIRQNLQREFGEPLMAVSPAGRVIFQRELTK